MIAAGLRGEASLTVTQRETALAMGSGGLAVFATPSMIALMEKAAMQSVAPYLQVGEGTVGTAIDVRHTAATPVGMRVSCRSEVICVHGRALTFRIEAYDAVGLIGTATHERVIVDNARFLQKAQAKLPGGQARS